MSKEGFYEPTKEEVDKAVESAKKQMEEYYKSQPTPENINEAMRSVAKQFGEKFEIKDSEVSDEDIIEEHKKNGWILVDIIDNAALIDISSQAGKEIKIVGTGTKFLIFEKLEN